MISGPLIAGDALSSPSSDLVFLDARAGKGAKEGYARQHVRGAIYADLERDLSAPDNPAIGGRHPLPALSVWCARLGAWGITPDTPVAIYDESSGAMAAARAWWMLHAIGHRKVAVVDGGLRTLVAAGVSTDDRLVRTEPRGAYEASVRTWPTVGAQTVARIAQDDSWALLDARAPERFSGEVEPIDPVAGHIPGARNLYWKSLTDELGRFLPGRDRTEAYQRALANASADRVVCYCGSGVTACHLLLGLEAAGVHGARLYVGSWSEWCRNHST
ncbi:MAG: rhodanese-like domain-containing protein [Myxococcota bacterium]